MSHRWSAAAAGLVVFVLAAGCGRDSTSPSRSDLNGAWSTGHTVASPQLGLDLQWTGETVAGSGGYAIWATNAPCSLGLSGTGNVTIVAVVTRSNALSGSMSFDNGPKSPMSGTVTDNGGMDSHIDVSFRGSDESVCSLTLRHALLP